MSARVMLDVENRSDSVASNDVPELVKGGLVRRALALLVDLLVVEVLLQGLAAIAFPLSGGALVDSNSIYTSCEPARGRPAGLEVPAGFEHAEASLCTKSLLGWPTARLYTVTRQEPGTHVKTSIGYEVGRGGGVVAAFDLAGLQGLGLALMRWLLERWGWRSLGRKWLSLQVRQPRAGGTVADPRLALDRRYALFALPYLPVLAVSVIAFVVQRLGGPMQSDMLGVLSGLSLLALTVCFLAAFGAIRRHRDAFYDAAAGTAVVRLIEGSAAVASGDRPVRESQAETAVAQGKRVLGKGVPWLSVAVCCVLATIYAGELARSFWTTHTLGVDAQTLLVFGGMDGELVRQLGQWSRLITAVFLHVGAAHLLGNAAVLLAAGWLLEGIFGRGWFLATFLLGGIGASLASVIWNPPTLLSVGSSGAITAVIAAGFVLSFGLADNEARLWLRAFCIGCLFATLQASGQFGLGTIDRADHVGGVAAGTLIGLLLVALRRRDAIRPSQGRLALAAALAVSAALFVSVPLAGFGDVKLQALLIPADDVPKTEAEWQARSAELVRRYPGDPRGHLARALEAGGDAEERERELARAVETQKRLDPADGGKAEQNAAMMVGGARAKARDWATARDLFTRAIKTSAPALPVAFSSRANAEVELGEFDAALLDMRRLASLDPDKAMGHRAVASILFAKGETKAAIAEAGDGLALAPDDPLALRERGWFKFFDRQGDGALADLERAVGVNPTDAYAALWLDIVSVRAGRGDRLQGTTIAKLDMAAWPAPVIRFYRGEIDVAALMAAAADPDPIKRDGQHCEALFYAGELQIIQHDDAAAESDLKDAAATCPKNFDEWAGAQAELRGDAGLRLE